MFFYLAQQGFIFLTNWFLTFDDASQDILDLISNFPTTIEPFINAIHAISFFFPVNDLLLYLTIFILLEGVLYATAFAMWLIRIATIGIVK
jgi:hypothetical protein